MRSQRYGVPLPPDPRQGGALRVAPVGIGSAASRAHLPALRDAEEVGWRALSASAT